MLTALGGVGIDPRLQEIVLLLGIDALQLAVPDSSAAEVFQRMVFAQGETLSRWRAMAACFLSRLCNAMYAYPRRVITKPTTPARSDRLW